MTGTLPLQSIHSSLCLGTKLADQSLLLSPLLGVTPLHALQLLDLHPQLVLLHLDDVPLFPYLVHLLTVRLLLALSEDGRGYNRSNFLI